MNDVTEKFDDDTERRRRIQTGWTRGLMALAGVLAFAVLAVSMEFSVLVSASSIYGIHGSGSAMLSVATGDADRGKGLFAKRCTGCHSLDQDKEGPRLRGVYGRQAGSVATFQYSSALKAAHIIWDDASLDKWLTDPDSVAPDNDMAFHVSSTEERADIIRFLKVASGKQ